MTAMSRRLKCARDGALSARSLLLEPTDAAADSDGSTSNISHLWRGVFRLPCCLCSTLSKWVYCMGCQASKSLWSPGAFSQHFARQSRGFLLRTLTARLSIAARRSVQPRPVVALFV